VLDGFVCLRHRGLQRNIRLSRRLRPDMGSLAVGPFRLETVEPLEVVRLVLEDDRRDLAFDLTCRTVGVPYMGPIEITWVDGRLTSERSTYELAGRCSGWVAVDGETIRLTDDSATFFRNHSWGNQRGRGGPRRGAPGPRHRTGGVRQWVLWSTPDHSGLYLEDTSGRAAASRGQSSSTTGRCRPCR